MRIVVVGSTKFTRHVIRHISEDWDVVGAVGKHMEGGSDRSNQTTFKDIAEERGMEYIPTSDINSPRIKERLESLEPNLCVCAGWTEIISEDVLSIPSEGFVGLHASYLPEGRGGAPVNWRIIHGEDSVGMSLFYFVSEVDSGDIIAQSGVSIEERDDISTVYDRLTVLSCDILEDFLRDIAEGEVDAEPQDTAEVSYRPNRKPMDSIISWEKGPSEQRDWVRALTDPYPNAFTFYEGSKVKIISAELPEGKTGNSDECGQILEVVSGEGLDVKTGEGSIRLKRVQVGDEPRMWGDDFAERYGLSRGDVLGKPSDYPEWLYTGIRDGNSGTQFNTNVEVGETTCFLAVACSHKETRVVDVEAKLDGEEVSAARLEVDGWVSEEIRCTPESPGAHTFKLTFYEGEEEIDRRYLKIYSA